MFRRTVGALLCDHMSADGTIITVVLCFGVQQSHRSCRNTVLPYWYWKKIQPLHFKCMYRSRQTINELPTATLMFLGSSCIDARFLVLPNISLLIYLGFSARHLFFQHKLYINHFTDMFIDG